MDEYMGNWWRALGTVALVFVVAACAPKPKNVAASQRDPAARCDLYRRSRRRRPAPRKLRRDRWSAHHGPAPIQRHPDRPGVVLRRRFGQPHRARPDHHGHRAGHTDQPSLDWQLRRARSVGQDPGHQVQRSGGRQVILRSRGGSPGAVPAQWPPRHALGPVVSHRAGTQSRHNLALSVTLGPSDRPGQSSSRSAWMNASWGTSTRPMFFMRFLPSFCFSSSLRLRVMSPP